jgi:hypothetical protein
VSANAYVNYFCKSLVKLPTEKCFADLIDVANEDRREDDFLEQEIKIHPSRRSGVPSHPPLTLGLVSQGIGLKSKECRAR